MKGEKMKVKDVIELLERTKFETVIICDGEVDYDDEGKFDVEEFGISCWGGKNDWLIIDSEDFEYEFSSIEQLINDHPEVLEMEVSKRFKMEMYFGQHYNISSSGNRYYGNDSIVKIHVK